MNLRYNDTFSRCISCSIVYFEYRVTRYERCERIQYEHGKGTRKTIGATSTIFFKYNLYCTYNQLWEGDRAALYCIELRSSQGTQ